MDDLNQDKQEFPEIDPLMEMEIVEEKLDGPEK
jgi:hypothetical protein